MTTVVIKERDPLWVRITRPLALAAVVYGLFVFLRDRSIFEAALITFFSALSFYGQTGGQGLPMPALPARFIESATILRRGVGESVWLWVAAGSRLWTFTQAVAFGLVAALAHWAVIGWLGGFMSLAAASVIGGVLAVAVCSFGLGLLIRRLASRFGVRPWWEEFKASLKRAVGAPKLDAVGPVGWLAIWSVVRASLVQAGKWGAENAAAWIFTGWGALFVIGGIAALVILVPESAIKWLSYLKTQNQKEKDDVGASSP